MGGVALFLALALLGLPGLANFVGEFLVLAGTFAVSPTLAVLGAVGFVLSAVYSLWLIYRVFHGAPRTHLVATDLGVREMAIFSLIIAGIVWLGVYPQPVLDTAKPQVESLLNSAAHVGTAATVDK